ncbi:energy transducer TonB [Marinimicrobium sp. C2-29]|uniref:energy transducer TonB n=1 Tax=Marinimicrobium sp. C2-29 TaxID=3139825 RepID=UPI003138FB2F
MRLKAYTIPVLVSVFLHAMMLVILLSAWDARPEPREVLKPRVVKAKVVEFTPKSQRQAEQEAAQQKVIDMRQHQQERERQEAERRRQQEAEARAQQQKREQEQREQAERERREAEAQARREREAEQQRQQAERERQERQERLERALAEEEEFFQAQQSERVAQSYVDVMAERIENQWSRPPSARTGMRCVLEIQLVPTGQVVNVTVVESSGNAAFDRSAEQAVKRVDRFEEVQDMPSQVFERHFRQLRLVFNPEDLRQ